MGPYGDPDSDEVYSSRWEMQVEHADILTPFTILEAILWKNVSEHIKIQISEELFRFKRLYGFVNLYG